MIYADIGNDKMLNILDFAVFKDGKIVEVEYLCQIGNDQCVVLNGEDITLIWID